MRLNADNSSWHNIANASQLHHGDDEVVTQIKGRDGEMPNMTAATATISSFGERVLSLCAERDLFSRICLVLRGRGVLISARERSRCCSKRSHGVARYRRWYIRGIVTFLSEFTKVSESIFLRYTLSTDKGNRAFITSQ